MFKTLRVLPVLMVLATLFMVGKTAGLGFGLEASLAALGGPEQAGESGRQSDEAEEGQGPAAMLQIADATAGAGAGAGDDPMSGVADTRDAPEAMAAPWPEPMPGASSQDNLAPNLEANLEAAAGAPGDAAMAPDAPFSPEAMLAPAAADPGADPGADGDPAEAGGGEEGMAPEVRDPFDISDEELELLQRLVERREELERRADNLDQREALMAATEARIADKMTELKSLQGVIEGLLVQHDEQEEAQMLSLVKIYESMKPKDAARIFEQLDMVVLLEVIGRMKERKSAPILAKMNPMRAKVVTLELAQRRELPVARQ